ncbi:hypothetical protein TNCT_627521 [Trichonephila clavata]|uniref:Uncharacterized protein n=1 Tax=Trichonephila clavata TaxID=2740835 RepID=A0A8X6L269_TRICU|nr:hypothetical protein TNCT_627521 [Trichonephila clavata]
MRGSASLGDGAIFYPTRRRGEGWNVDGFVASCSKEEDMIAYKKNSVRSFRRNRCYKYALKEEKEKECNVYSKNIS